MAGKASDNSNRRAHFTLIWKILSSDKDRSFCSPDFTIQSMEMTKWRVDVVFDVNGNPALGSIKRLNDDGPKKIQIEFEIAYFDSNGFASLRSFAYFPKNYISYDYEFPDMVEARSDCCPTDSVAVRCRIWRKGTEISKPELCFVSTQFDVYLRQYVWAVKQFSLVLQGEKRTRVLNGNIKACPELILILSLAENNGQECVSLDLETPHLTDAFTIKAETSLLDAEGMIVLSVQKDMVIFPSSKIRKLGTFDKIELQRKNLLSDDVLVFQCKLKISTGNPVWEGVDDYRLMDYSDDSKVFQKEESASHCNEPNKTAVCPFKENVSKFMDDGTFSDVCLRAGTKSFPMHKLILSSRSPTFRKMFTSGMGERTSNKCIDIPELDTETLKHLLLYIYKDEVQELTWENAANLLKAADKCELSDLKEKCSCVLKSNLSKSNICEILILADKYKDESLLNSVQEFIRNNSEILRSDVWKVFKKNHSKLALETAERIICNLK